MKLPVTDKFLWEVYSFIEKTEPVKNFILGNAYVKAKILLGDQNPVFEKYRREKGRKEFSRFIYYLKRKNYIKIENLNNKKALIITRGGLSKAFMASFKMEGKVKRKDGKWIMVIFDIPTKHGLARSILNSILRNLGYKLFQQSVWVSPYNVLEKTEKLFQMHSLDSYIKIFLIEKI